MSGRRFMSYRNIPNRRPGGLEISPRGDYIRFKEPSATLTNDGP